MNAREINFLKFLQQSNQFRIPIYQRTYSWTIEQCRQLWNDIMVAGDPAITGHFLGSVVYIERGLYRVADVPQLLVIDGQQRLTTLTLLLIALGRALDEQGIREEISRQKITNYYLVNREEVGDLRYKLILTQSDQVTLKRLIDDLPPPSPASVHILANYRFFEDQIHKPGTDLLKVHQGIRKLIIVQIALDRDHDDPQRIFESLNSTGLKLSQADLIRNYVLMDLDPAEQEALYDDYWYGMEHSFRQTEPGGLFDRFIRDYLTCIARTGAIPKLEDVYTSFKAYVRDLVGAGIPVVVAEVHRYAGYYVRMARDEEPHSGLRELFGAIKTLRVDVSYPFLLQLYSDYSQARLTLTDFIAILKLVESYVFRRAVVGIPTNSLNKTFATLAQYIDPSHYLDSLQARLLGMTGYQRFPTDEEFRAALIVKDVYNTRSAPYLLAKLENYNHKETANTASATIEHILPQNPNLSSAWQNELGEDWETIQKTYAHTLGNLTLTGYNSELGDRPFAEKCTMPGGYADSTFRLTRMVAKWDRWTAEAILERATALAEEAAQVWPRPTLSVEAAVGYRHRPDSTQPAGATTTRKPDNGTPSTLDAALTVSANTHDALFDALRLRILALGPAVVEQPFTAKVWPHAHISYGAPATFVDVVLQKNLVRLCLNIPFAELDDLRDLAQNVTGQGFWGGGSVKVRLRMANQIDYMIHLIGQAYAFQTAAHREETPRFGEYEEWSRDEEEDRPVREALRRKFWQQLLDQARAAGLLPHAGRSPTSDHWLNGKTGRSGLAYTYILRGDRTAVNLDIGTKDRDRNKRIFDRLYAQKQEIESNFGGELRWRRMDDKLSSQITFDIPGGGLRSPEQDWPRIQEAMIAAMRQLSVAFDSAIAQLPDS